MGSKRDNGPSGTAAVFGQFASAIQVITGPWTRENGGSWLRLIVVVLTVWWFFIQPFRIPTDSMVPTLNGDPGFFVGDRVFVNKLAFGPRIPFTTKRIMSWGHPERFDVAVFRTVEPEPPANSPWGRAMNFLLPKVLIKRVIGLPGERVHIENGKVYINGEPLELPPDMPPVEYTSPALPSWVAVEQSIRADNPPDLEHVIENTKKRYALEFNQFSQMKYGCLPTDEYALVPEGHYLMLGDNSANSLDGRYWGWAPEDYMLGRAFCVWWPIKNRKDLSGFTDTWWGLALLWGIPGLLLGYEFILRPFLAVSLRVRSQGLSGKLRRGDRVLINRLAFGLRRPFSDKRLSKGREPERGELVAYFVPIADGIDYAGEALMGVIHGLPSDTIAVEGGLLVVNGASTGIRADSEGKPGRIKRNSNVPQGRYLILSGADDDAPDSRAFGVVPHELLIGPASFVWWPPQRAKRAL
ncbi:MAG: signal peptidase I [Candidatus Hydrogenedentes bacterium]|nr:signal peptidase I [Candidatus Hydrogenedentota bacterium]